MNNHHSVVIACRDAAEAEHIRTVLGEPSTPFFQKSGSLLTHLDAMPGAFVIMTSLMLDENAAGLLTKLSIINPTYSILYARHCNHALNVLRLFGCGCFAILGPEELEFLPGYMDPPESLLEDMVMPPFFINDNESSLKEPTLTSAQPLHVSFLGSQALMSFSNCLLNIEASSLMSFSCVGPSNAWAREKIEQSMLAYTRWTMQPRLTITGGMITLCQDFNQLASLEPTGQHFIVRHGLITPDEEQYLKRQSEGATVFTATDEGYIGRVKSEIDTCLTPERLWDVMISALYQA